MVEDIEELAAEAESGFFGELELALDAEVGLCGVECAQDVAAEIALLPGWSRDECGLIEDFATG